jgi:hypothetical protein
MNIWTLENWRQEKAAQILTIKQRTIDDVVLQKVQQIDLSGNNIKGCTIMKDGNTLFTENNSGQVLKYDSNDVYSISMIHHDMLYHT